MTDNIAADMMQPIQLLMVEDNPDDVDLTMEAFKEGKIKMNMDIVVDGVEAMDYLHQRGKYESAPRPELILLDLNLPRKDGRQVLAEIKADENLRSIPVVVLTTSSSEEDIFQAYDLCVNCFITKPVDFNQFIKVVRSIESFWFTVVQLPSPR